MASIESLSEALNEVPLISKRSMKKINVEVVYPREGDRSKAIPLKPLGIEVGGAIFTQSYINEAGIDQVARDIEATNPGVILNGDDIRDLLDNNK